MFASLSQEDGCPSCKNILIAEHRIRSYARDSAGCSWVHTHRVNVGILAQKASLQVVGADFCSVSEALSTSSFL